MERPVQYRDVDYTVAALVTVPSALSYRYYGSDEFILNDETFVQDTGTDSVMYYAFDTTDEANAAMEAFLADYTGNVNPELDYESKATYAAEFESMRSMFLLLGGALSFIVGLVGVLNFFNAVLTGIIARRRELAVLQAVGMTGGQLRTMLVWEGLLYALGAAELALVLTLALGPVAFGPSRAVLVLHLPPDPGPLPADHPPVRPAGGGHPRPHRPGGGKTHRGGTAPGGVNAPFSSFWTQISCSRISG